MTETGNGLIVGGATGALVPFGTPLYAAGVDVGDHIVAIDGAQATRRAWDQIRTGSRGSRHALTIERRGGRRETVSLALAEDPALRIVPAESRRALTASERAFRDAWLGTRVK
jgi:predicted metalloprotease with PDZ domain